MAVWHVELSESAEADLAELDKPIRRRVIGALEWLADNFDSIVLEYGSHSTKSKASIGNQLISGYSYAANFKVGTKNVAAVGIVAQSNIQGDQNVDGKVNLVDFSILAFWFKRLNPPSKVDLNHDGKVDLIDFSIMAYNWTG